MKKIRNFFKAVFFLIVCLAGIWQMYNLVYKKKVIEGPIPLKEAKVLLQAAHQLMASNQFDQASEKFQRVLKMKEKAPEIEAEAVLQLKVIKKRGGNVPALPELTQEVSIEQIEGNQNFFEQLKKREIKVTGKGVYPPGKPPAQGKLMAERAAKLDAYRLLLEEIKGISINGRISVSDVMVQDVIHSKVSGKIQGAQVVATRDLRNEEIFEVDMVLSGEAILASLR